MPNKKLKFISTKEIDLFKAYHPLGALKIIQNPKIGKYFFTFVVVKGAVIRNYPQEKLHHPVISEVLNQETGETFYLLHNKGENERTMPRIF